MPIHLGHLTALSVTVAGMFYISLDGDEFVWARHLQDQVIGERWPPEECIVCHFKIGYHNLHVLGAEVPLSPKCHGKSDLANWGCCCSGDYSMEGSPTQM
jgi:hypothetical protein